MPMFCRLAALPVLSLALSAAMALAAEMSRDDLREMEDLLSRLGFPPGVVDGTVDDKTRAAITGYQAFAALPGDPEPSRALLEELRGVVGQVEALRLARDEEATTDLGDFGETEAEPEPPAELQPAAEQAAELVEPAPDPPPAVDNLPALEEPAGQTVMAESLLDETPPEDTVAGEAASEALALEASVPVELISPEPVLEAPIEADPAPAETVLAEDLPQENLPREAAPAAATVEAPAPEEAVIEEPAPDDKAPDDTAPKESAAEEPATEEPTAEGPDTAGSATAQTAVLPAPEPEPAPAPSAADLERARISKALAPYQAELSSGELSYGDLARNFNDQGRGSFNRGRYDQALGDFTIAIYLQPNFAAAYHNRAKVHQAMGDAARAEKDFDKAFDLGFTRLNLQ